MGDFQQVLQTVIPSPSVVHTPSAPSYVPVVPPVIPSPQPPSNTPIVPTFVTPSAPAPVILPAKPVTSQPIILTTTTNIPPTGNILPNITFQSQGIPYYIPLSYLSSLVPKDPLFVSTVNAGTVNANIMNASTINSISTFSQNISTNYIETTEAYVDDKLTLDNQVLTADATSLLLNGIPLVTTANISSLSDWALDPAVSTIQANGNDLIDVRFANISSIVADGLTVVKLTTLFSTTIEVFESTITSETQKLTVSSINGGHAFFDFLTAGSVINPSASTINCDYLNVASNATFSGTRPNFTTGINTSGANNFNNQNLDNCGQINAANLSLNAGAMSVLASGTVDILADSGGSILTNTAISLATQNGGSSVINIAAKRNALLAYPVPLSQVNITAEGNCPNIPVVPLTPYGGAVNIVACNAPDPIFPLTAITNAFAPGAIHMTAYSKGLFPGLITEAAGSILAYSGLTSPTAGLYGCSFYSALTCLSLSAGLSPALTSFPGTVFIRGDNGTKVVNGLYADTIYNNAGGNLLITTQDANTVNITNVRNINMSNSPTIDGGGGATSRIQNFFNISGSNVNTPQLNATNVSTSALSVGSINTTSISIGSYETATNVDLTITANQTIDEFLDPVPNNLNLVATSNINITIPNNNAYSINMSGSVYISKNLYVTSNIDAATINGSPYPPVASVPNDLTVSSINAPLALFSTVNASTLTFSAQENISLNANVSTPTFFNTGNIAMNAEKDIDLMANINLTVGAGNEIDITAASTITLTAPTINLVGTVTSTINVISPTINLDGTVYTSGNLAVSTITGVTSINGSPYVPGGGGGSVPSNLIVSTLTASSTIQGSSFYGNAQGLSWSQSGSVGGQNWSAVTGGLTSGIYYACVNGGYIYYSTNGGVTWTQQATVQAWTGIAAGSTSGVAFACVAGGGIYFTTNSGTTWTLSGSAPTANWSCCAINTANSLGFACINGGGIYTTANGGSTWTLSPAPTANWNSCTLINTSTWMAINTNLPDILYYSQNGGTTFTALPGTPTQTGLFMSITLSAMTSQIIILLGSSGTSYATNISNTFNPSTWRVLPGISGYIGANNCGSVIVNANPNNPIKVSYDNANTWITTNSPSLPWSCVLRGQLPLTVSALVLPSTTSINPCLVGTNTGFIYTNVPFANIPRTDIIGHNITIADDTSVLTLTGTLCRISTLGAVDVASKSQINLAVDNGFINFNAATRVQNTRIFYQPKDTRMASPAGTDVRQPFIQYGIATGSGGSGTVVVTIPQAYSNTTYVVQVTMRDAPSAELYATPTATNSFTIGWTSAGTGTQNIMWTSFGT